MRKDEEVIVKTPWDNCPIGCMYFQHKMYIEKSEDGGSVLKCDLENLCKNAVHIAWGSLSTEEKIARLNAESE